MDNHWAGGLEAIMMRGDRGAAAALVGDCMPQLIREKNRVLRALTQRYREGSIPFCQLTAACQSAAVFCDDTLLPVACCGAVAGNTSPTGCNFMMMFLRGWGLPAMDLGTNVQPEAFLSAIRQQNLRFAVCVAFSEADIPAVVRLHDLAVAEGMRDRFSLLMTGVNPGSLRAGLPTDCPEHSAAAVAEWMVDAWQR